MGLVSVVCDGGREGVGGYMLTSFHSRFLGYGATEVATEYTFVIPILSRFTPPKGFGRTQELKFGAVQPAKSHK